MTISPMINKQTLEVMTRESLIALRRFELSGDRSLFNDWLKRWKRELEMIETVEGDRHDSLNEGIE